MWQRRLVSLSYHGSQYYGFSVSPSKPTIKEILYQKLFSILPKEASKVDLGFQYSSRTDSGVHALDQKCSFLFPEFLSDKKAHTLINSRLPRDIQVESLYSVDNGYNLRDHILGKDYYYWISFQSRNPFFSTYRWDIPFQYSVKQARKYISLISGEHDFAHFSKNQKQYKSTICTIYKAQIRELRNRQWLIQIRGNRFLHHMIRFVIGYLFAWLKDDQPIPPSYEDLFSLKCQASSLLAPADGLYLVKTWLDNELKSPNWIQKPFQPFPLL